MSAVRWRCYDSSDAPTGMRSCEEGRLWPARPFASRRCSTKTARFTLTACRTKKAKGLSLRCAPPWDGPGELSDLRRKIWLPPLWWGCGQIGRISLTPSPMPGSLGKSAKAREYPVMVILDTDVMIDLLHGHPPAVAWLESLGDTEVCLPGFVAMELIRGCRNGQERRKLKKQISRYAFCSLSPRTARPRCPCSRTFTWPLAWGVLHALTGWTAVASGCPLYAFNDVSMFMRDRVSSGVQAVECGRQEGVCHEPLASYNPQAAPGLSHHTYRSIRRLKRPPREDVCGASRPCANGQLNRLGK